MKQPFRNVLSSVATLATLTLVSACGGQEEATNNSGDGFPESASGTLNLYNYANYTDPEMIKLFEEETGIEVQLDTYASGDQLLAKLQSGQAGYDVVVPTDYAVDQLIQLDLLERVEPIDFPNAENLKESFVDVYFDSGRHYSVPYMYGTTGYVYDSAVITSPMESWADFFDAPSEAAGKVSVFDDQTEVVNAALRAVSAEPCSEDPAEYELALEALKGLRPDIKVIASDGTIGRIVSGEVVLQTMYNGQYKRAAEDKSTLEYVIPEEGASLSAENFVVPKGAPNMDAAKIFMNWMMDPEHAAMASNYTGYDNAIDGSAEFLDPGLAEDPSFNLSPDDLALVESVPTCSEAAIELQDQVWTEFKS